MSSSIDNNHPPLCAATARYCYLDIDINQHRIRLARAADFVRATDTRYGFSSNDLRLLGGSELQRIPELYQNDHEWQNRGDITIRPPTAGNRLVVQLHWDVAPLACENFATLCANGGQSFKTNTSTVPAPIGESGKPLSYRGSIIHRIVPGFVVQGGDFVFGNGAGGESIFAGKKFKDERAGLLQKHSRRGLLSMGNSGKNSNSSQFFFTLDKVPQCDGKHVVFGELISGWEVLDEAEKYGSASGAPTVSVIITDCGLWLPLETPGAGYWYDQPDPGSYMGFAPVFMVRPRVALVAPSIVAGEKFLQVLLPHHSVHYQFDIRDSTAPNNVEVDNSGKKTLVIRKIMNLLEAYSVDVVLVAPACLKDIQVDLLKSSWAEKYPLETIVLASKPLDAGRFIRTKSWLKSQKSWHLDGQYQ